MEILTEPSKKLDFKVPAIFNDEGEITEFPSNKSDGDDLVDAFVFKATLEFLGMTRGNGAVVWWHFYDNEDSVQFRCSPKPFNLIFEHLCEEEDPDLEIKNGEGISGIWTFVRYGPGHYLKPLIGKEKKQIVG